MAIVSTIIGGVFGFFAFLISLIATDMTIWNALSAYVLVGSGVTVAMMLTAILAAGNDQNSSHASAAFQGPQQPLDLSHEA